MSTETATAVSIETLVAQYRALRDVKAEISNRAKTEAAAVQTRLDAIAGQIKEFFDANGLRNTRTAAGTAYIETKVSATVGDREAFRAYVQENNAWDLIDMKANAPACTDHVEAHKVPPPGVNYSTREVVNVRA